MTFLRMKDKNEVTVICVDVRFSAGGVLIRLRHGVDHGESLLFTDRPSGHGAGKGAADESQRPAAFLRLRLRRILKRDLGEDTGPVVLHRPSSVLRRRC